MKSPLFRHSAGFFLESHQYFYAEALELLCELMYNMHNLPEKYPMGQRDRSLS